MNRQVAALSALIAFGVANSMAIAMFASQEWFGISDLPAFSIWSMLLSILVYMLFRLQVMWRLARVGAPARSTVLIVTGTLAGLLSTLGTALILGGMIGTFSVPVLYCWLWGGMSAGIFAALMYKPSEWEVVVLLAMVATTGLIGLAAYGNSPETEIAVVFSGEASPQDREQFWKLIRKPRGGRSELKFLERIAGAGISDHNVYTVRLKPHTRRQDIDSIMSRLGRLSRTMSVTHRPRATDRAKDAEKSDTFGLLGTY